MSRFDALGEQREVTLGQGTVRYRERGSGEPIVFVHGAFANGDLWRAVVPRLAGEGYRCVTPDWPLGGHQPALREDADLSPPGLARLIDDFVAALELDGCTLVGNDTGGALAQLVAANHPQRLGRLVLTSCDAFEHFFPVLFRYLQLLARIPGGLSALRATARFKPVRRAPNAFGWLMKEDIPLEVRQSWTEPLRDPGVRRDASKVLRGIHRRHTLEAAERLRSFDKPVLIAWAAEDRVFPLDDARKLAEIFPDARLETISDSYSFIPEDQPERLASLMLDFLRETQPARAGA